MPALAVTPQQLAIVELAPPTRGRYRPTARRTVRTIVAGVVALRSAITAADDWARSTATARRSQQRDWTSSCTTSSGRSARALAQSRNCKATPTWWLLWFPSTARSSHVHKPIPRIVSSVLRRMSPSTAANSDGERVAQARAALTKSIRPRQVPKGSVEVLV
jgi:hypothetical protein